MRPTQAFRSCFLLQISKETTSRGHEVFQRLVPLKALVEKQKAAEELKKQQSLAAIAMVRKKLDLIPSVPFCFYHLTSSVLGRAAQRNEKSQKGFRLLGSNPVGSGRNTTWTSKVNKRRVTRNRATKLVGHLFLGVRRFDGFFRDLGCLKLHLKNWIDMLLMGNLLRQTESRAEPPGSACQRQQMMEWEAYIPDPPPKPEEVGIGRFWLACLVASLGWVGWLA